VTPGRLVDLVDRAARNIAGVVDEDVDVGGILHKPGDVLRFAQVNDMSRRVDLMRRSQPLGEGLQLVRRCGQLTGDGNLPRQGLGGGGTDALGRAGDQDALAAQMEIHGIALLMGDI